MSNKGDKDHIKRELSPSSLFRGIFSEGKNDPFSEEPVEDLVEEAEEAAGADFSEKALNMLTDDSRKGKTSEASSSTYFWGNSLVGRASSFRNSISGFKYRPPEPKPSLSPEPVVEEVIEAPKDEDQKPKFAPSDPITRRPAGIRAEALKPDVDTAARYQPPQDYRPPVDHYNRSSEMTEMSRMFGQMAKFFSEREHANTRRNMARAANADRQRLLAETKDEVSKIVRTEVPHLMSTELQRLIRSEVAGVLRAELSNGITESIKEEFDRIDIKDEMRRIDAKLEVVDSQLRSMEPRIAAIEGATDREIAVHLPDGAINVSVPVNLPEQQVSVTAPVTVNPPDVVFGPDAVNINLHKHAPERPKKPKRVEFKRDGYDRITDAKIIDDE